MSVTTMLGDHDRFSTRKGAAIRRFGPYATGSRVTERCQIATFQRGGT